VEVDVKVDDPLCPKGIEGENLWSLGALLFLCANVVNLLDCQRAMGIGNGGTFYSPESPPWEICANIGGWGVNLPAHFSLPGTLALGFGPSPNDVWEMEGEFEN
jgi:hypothetical protein